MNFTKRLRAVQQKGRLSYADLHHWFDRDYSTVRAWVIGGYTPRGFLGEEAVDLLTLLERTLTDFEDLRGVSSYERPARIRQLRKAASRRRVPKTHSAGRRV
jgi:hypothetical protein